MSHWRRKILYTRKQVIIFAAVNALLQKYENLSREELVFTVAKLHHELDQLKKLVFGSRHERFIANTAPSKDQLPLGLDVAEIPAVSVSTQKIEYTRTAPKPASSDTVSGRMKLPAHLPRTRVVITPEEDVSGMQAIGEEITEELDYTPGKFFVREYARPKYVRANVQEGQSPIVIADLPSRVIDKGIVGPGLMAQILIDKYVDHLPLYRQNERFKRDGINIPSSTLSDWVGKSGDKLEPLTERLKALVLNSDYLEADETTIRVLDNGKKGKTHLGYYWVYRAPESNLVLFDYREGRGSEGPRELLKNFRGYLQTDGYSAYDAFGDANGITLVGCMAHARRGFFEARGNDSTRAEHALKRIQALYAIERRARDQGLTHEQRLVLRQEESIPILEELGHWLKESYGEVLPQSVIGKAIAYALKRWDKLMVYTTDGKLEIDNNLVENAIRPVALGRKNYLFAGSHRAAARAAGLYSLFGSCKINHINPFDWLSDVIARISDHPVNNLDELLPHRWQRPSAE